MWILDSRSGLRMRIVGSLAKKFSRTGYDRVGFMRPPADAAGNTRPQADLWWAIRAVQMFTSGNVRAKLA